MRSTVAPISKVGSQGHSPLPYQAGRRDRKWRSCRIRARARIERESRCACLPATPLVVRRRSFSLALSLSLSPSQDPCHTRTMPPRCSAPRSTTHWQGSLRDTCYFLLDFSPSPAAGCSSPLPPPPLSSTSSSSSSPLSHRRCRFDASWCTSRRWSPLGARDWRDTGFWITLLISSETWLTLALLLFFSRCLTVLTTHLRDDYVQVIAWLFQITDVVTWSKRKLLFGNRWQPECHVAVMHGDARCRVDSRGRSRTRAGASRYRWLVDWFPSPLRSPLSRRDNHFEFLPSPSLGVSTRDGEQWPPTPRVIPALGLGNYCRLSRHLSPVFYYTPRNNPRGFSFRIAEITLFVFISRALLASGAEFSRNSLFEIQWIGASMVLFLSFFYLLFLIQISLLRILFAFLGLPAVLTSDSRSSRAADYRNPRDRRERTREWAPVQTIASTRWNNRPEPVAADSNSLSTWRRRRRPRDCRRYDARRRSVRRHLTARQPTGFTAVNPLEKRRRQHWNLVQPVLEISI